MNGYKKIIFVLFIAIFCSTVSAAEALAQQGDSGLMPPQAVAQTNTTSSTTDDDTHPILRLTPDKSEIIRLESDAASIIIGSETHLRIFMDTPQILVAVPGLPGATYFTILDTNGRVIMQRHVVVGAPKEKYVRIRRCDTPGCNSNRVYYCPDNDMCHETVVAQEALSGSSGAISTSGAGGSSMALPTLGTLLGIPAGLPAGTAE